MHKWKSVTCLKTSEEQHKPTYKYIDLKIFFLSNCALEFFNIVDLERFQRSTLIAFPLPTELSDHKLCFSEKMSLQTLHNSISVFSVFRVTNGLRKFQSRIESVQRKNDTFNYRNQNIDCVSWCYVVYDCYEIMHASCSGQNQ